MNRIGAKSCELEQLQSYRTGEVSLSTLSVEELSSMLKNLEKTKHLIETSTRPVIEDNIDKLTESGLIKFLTSFQIEKLKPSVLNKKALRVLFPEYDKKKSLERMSTLSTPKLNSIASSITGKKLSFSNKEAIVLALFKSIHTKDHPKLEKKRCENLFSRSIRLDEERLSLDSLDDEWGSSSVCYIEPEEKGGSERSFKQVSPPMLTDFALFPPLKEGEKLPSVGPSSTKWEILAKGSKACSEPLPKTSPDLCKVFEKSTPTKFDFNKPNAKFSKAVSAVVKKNMKKAFKNQISQEAYSDSSGSEPESPIPDWLTFSTWELRNRKTRNRKYHDA